MLLKACSRCGNLIPYGRAYCEACEEVVKQRRAERAQKASKESNRRYNRGRDPRYQGFYNSKGWRTLSRKRIQVDGYRCVKCGAIATEVDHIIPIQTPEGWERRYDLGNLQSLCTRCHNAKHKRFTKRQIPDGS
jgi:5-methylcytosine-specific restriction endonuclease McrA